MAGEKKSNGKRDEPNQEFENFQRLLKGTLSVPKEELDRRRIEYEWKKQKKQTG